MKTKNYLYEGAVATFIDETIIHSHPLAVVYSFDGRLSDATLFSIIGLKEGTIKRCKVLGIEDDEEPEYYSSYIYSN